MKKLTFFALALFPRSLLIRLRQENSPRTKVQPSKKKKSNRRSPKGDSFIKKNLPNLRNLYNTSQKKMTIDYLNAVAEYEDWLA